MLRWLLLRAADSQRLGAFARRDPRAQRVALRFVAGETAEEGLTAAANLAASGLTTTLDHVGEFVTNLDHARRAADVYLEVLARAQAQDLPTGVSVKPSQLGVLIDEDACAALLGEIAARAAEVGAHVTLDMEDHRLTEVTVRLVERMHAAGHAHVGCAIQAALHRTPGDAKRLTALGASLRLCKGAYVEPAEIAHHSRPDVARAFLAIAQYLLDSGNEPRFATHDHRLIAAIQRLADRSGRDADTFEFQLLHGIRPDLARALRRDGHRVRIYVPFGPEWFPYFTRRLAERPANLALFIRTLVGRDRQGGGR